MERGIIGLRERRETERGRCRERKQREREGMNEKESN